MEFHQTSADDAVEDRQTDYVLKVDGQGQGQGRYKLKYLSELLQQAEA